MIEFEKLIRMLLGMPGMISKETKSQKRNLGLLYKTGKIVFVLSSRIKKTDAPSVFYKSSTDKKSFFNKDEKFVVTKRFENHRGTEFNRIQELDTGRKTEGRFLIKELFALEKNVQRG